MFTNGQNVQANDLNNFSVATVTTSGDVTVGDDLAVAGDATVGGALAVTGTLTVGGQPVAINRASCQGRLTLTSNVPVTTSDVTAATTIYFTPFLGNELGLHTGTTWVAYEFSQVSIAVPATTATMYDLFYDYNDGTPILAALAWTNDTTRAVSLTTEDGIYVKTGDTQQRYLGSFRTTGVSGQTEDSVAKRYLWNYYHRTPRPLRVTDATNSWTYDSTTYQQANASAANQIDVVVGVAEVLLDVEVIGFSTHNVANLNTSVSIGEDAITPATGVVGMRQALLSSSAIAEAIAVLRKYPAVGRHYYTWLESGGGATTTWYGDNNVPTLAQAGISGVIHG
jgi:hypothetical protein